MNKLSKKNAGYICLVLGGLFVLASLILFALSNWVNLSSKKVTATILANYDITTSDGEEKCMLDLNYRVGDDFITSTYEYPGKVDDDQFEIDVYYNIKDPMKIVEAGWSFSPLWTVLFGLTILSFGLYLTEIFTFGLPEREDLSTLSSDKEKQIFNARERVENNLLPAIGSVAIMIFGIVLIVLGYGWWSWIFAIGGAIVTTYFMLDLVPAITDYNRINSSYKLKGKVVEEIELDLDDTDNEDIEQ